MKTVAFRSAARSSDVPIVFRSEEDDRGPSWPFLAPSLGSGANETPELRVGAGTPCLPVVRKDASQ